MLLEAKGEFPRSIISASSGYTLNGIIHAGTLPDFTVGQDGAQLYVNVGPQQVGKSQNNRDAQIITWTGTQGFKRLDTSAVMNHGRDAAGVLISVDVAFEVKDSSGAVHTYQLSGDYSAGDAMAFTIAGTTSAD